MTKIRHSYNGHLFPDPGTKIDCPVQTVPNQAMSMREIFSRYAAGQPLGGARQEIWLGEDDDMPDLAHLDLAEKQALVDAARDELVDLNKKDKQRKAEKAQRSLTEYIDKQTAARLTYENSQDDGRPSPSGNERKKQTEKARRATNNNPQD